MLDKEDLKLIETYENSSRDDDAGYSPLMCTAFTEDVKGVKALIEQARENGKLKEVLQFTNTFEATKCLKATGENILFIKKNEEIFKLCCNAALECGVLEELLRNRDKDGDNILHQIVEFGRLHVVKTLLEINKDYPEIKEILIELLEQKNKDGHTPIDLTENFDQSTVVSELRNKEELNYQYEATKKMLSDIKQAFEEIIHTSSLKLSH